MGACLQALATLYGLVRVERASAFLLAAGALSGADTIALRGHINDICATFAGVHVCLVFYLEFRVLSSTVAEIFTHCHSVACRGGYVEVDM